MTVHFCKTCKGDGLVCPKCGEKWGSRGDGRAFGALKNKHRRKYGGCGVKRGDAIKCPSHTEAYAECDLCGVQVPGSIAPADWTRELVPGAKSGHVLPHVCPSCVGALRYGFDLALEAASNKLPLLTESIACAWAFHLGQYEDAARAERWDTNRAENTAGVRMCDWMLPTFIAPNSLGRYGAGGNGAGGIMVPPEFAGEVMDLIERETPIRRVSVRPLDPRRMRELLESGLSPEAAEAALEIEAEGGTATVENVVRLLDERTES